MVVNFFEVVVRWFWMVLGRSMFLIGDYEVEALS